MTQNNINNHKLDDALKLYKDIDAATEQHYAEHTKKAPCAKGCASCCSQFFEISKLEFELISQSLDEWSDASKAELASNAQILFSTFKEHWPNLYESYFSPETIHLNSEEYYKDSKRFDVTIPCVFLSPEGSCKIYDRRPSVCRTTGVGFLHLFNTGAVCGYIKLGIATPLWQADLRPFKEEIDALRWLEDPANPEKYMRQYPMFYYVYDYLKKEIRL